MRALYWMETIGRAGLTLPLFVVFVGLRMAVAVVLALGMIYGLAVGGTMGLGLFKMWVQRSLASPGGVMGRLVSAFPEWMPLAIGVLGILIVVAVLANAVRILISIFMIANLIANALALGVIRLGAWDRIGVGRSRRGWYGASGGHSTATDRDWAAEQAASTRRAVELGALPPWMDPGAIPPAGYWPEGTHGATNPRRDIE